MEDTTPTDLISASDCLARHAKCTREAGMAIKSHLTSMTEDLRETALVRRSGLYQIKKRGSRGTPTRERT